MLFIIIITNLILFNLYVADIYLLFNSFYIFQIFLKLEHLIPTSFLREFNKLVNDSSYPQPNNIKAPFIKCIEEYRSFVTRMHLPYSLSPDI